MVVKKKGVYWLFGRRLGLLFMREHYGEGSRVKEDVNTRYFSFIGVDPFGARDCSCWGASDQVVEEARVIPVYEGLLPLDLYYNGRESGLWLVGSPLSC